MSEQTEYNAMVRKNEKVSCKIPIPCDWQNKDAITVDVPRLHHRFSLIPALPTKPHSNCKEPVACKINKSTRIYNLRVQITAVRAGKVAKYL